MKVIYLHGFGSIGHSSKSGWLRDELGKQGHTVIAPDLPDKPAQAALFLDDYLKARQGESICLIGTSLGGFYAAFYAEKYNWPSVLINPLADVADLINAAMGENRNYYTNELFILDQCDSDKLRRMSEEMLSVTTVPSLLLLDKGDELLDYTKALQRYANVSERALFEGGSHRFAHLPESLDKILTVLKA
ncbi:MAG: YqiA/YcfP family alpha/beta fold hydrolase [Mariprofundus sp.]|nr:YqiA/YcfP family alpha/beta fold hydrolase [Mariprofundus sp.]